ncbi:geranyl-CoA carboxylase subunit apha [Arenicella sp. 4NH20-0111]|uniref:acetyl/propionyl/methylcrotonyl-CoA carboxylase subunit alpha n=1 Tax=Arenicella sp. 4NH20-0111 TaxID=3127648 RepID=UPI003104ABBF
MKKIDKILIANRGEIAVRVIRSARELGCQSVAVYSQPDSQSLHVQLADEAILLSGELAGDTYLDIDKIIDAALLSGADAIHPGYGFLSENARFAERCESDGITFIGPSADVIKLMGSKRQSKIAMLNAGVPCIQGYQGIAQGDQELEFEAKKIGTPLMIKASAGGGGRGMRLVHDIDNFSQELRSAKQEALNAFGSDEVILEAAVIKPRHIEIQIFADQHGNVVHLGERDCSIQRRHQKVVEEAPSPFMTESLRDAMGAAAVNAAKACGYVGAGTVEFLVSEDQAFYFLEMNTRLQVEHPVTELITGIDMVAWQIAVAAGETLPLSQSEISLKGHAVEVRVYAEDPRHNFMPQTGTIWKWSVPISDSYRVDSGIGIGQRVSAYYDPMLAKLVAFGASRNQAIENLMWCLDRTVLLGLENNLSFLRDVVSKENFKQGSVTTSFLLDNYSDGVFQKIEAPSEDLALAGALMHRSQQIGGRQSGLNWRNATTLEKHIVLEYYGKSHTISVSNENQIYRVRLITGGSNVEADIEYVFEISPSRENAATSVSYLGVLRTIHHHVNGSELFLQTPNGHFSFTDQTYQPASKDSSRGDENVTAIMDGAVVELNVSVGDYVEVDQVVGSLEAMKMIHTMKASINGVVDQISVSVGQQVKAREVIAIIKEPS